MVWAVVHDKFLDFSLPGRRFPERFHASHFQRTDFANAIGRVRRNPFVIPFHTAVREYAVDLSHFFIQVHFPQKGLGSFFRAFFRITDHIGIHGRRLQSLSFLRLAI